MYAYLNATYLLFIHRYQKVLQGRILILKNQEAEDEAPR
jgi:hypothetical protein